MDLITREFRVRQLQRFADGANILRLYSNDYTPTGEETATSFTEVRGGGYVPIVLEPERWSVRAMPEPTATYPRTVFAFTGRAGTVVGFYVTSEGLVVEAGRFPDGPYEIVRDGEDIKVSLTIQG